MKLSEKNSEWERMMRGGERERERKRERERDVNKNLLVL